jgi:hypothetical protein
MSAGSWRRAGTHTRGRGWVKSLAFAELRRAPDRNKGGKPSSFREVELRYSGSMLIPGTLIGVVVVWLGAETTSSARLVNGVWRVSIFYKTH